MVQLNSDTQWFANRNLTYRGSVTREAIIYCLVALSRFPQEVPEEVVVALIEAGAFPTPLAQRPAA